MSSIHYFQRYSQPENVATNNTLLLLSRLYQHSPNKFKGFLNELLGDTEVQAGVSFSQQERGKGSVPDGYLMQTSFKVVIETKMYDNFSVQQLTEHLNSFGKEEQKILLSLSPKVPNTTLQIQVKSGVDAFNLSNGVSVKYVPTTFQEIIDKFNNILEDHDFELIEIVNDYEDYCIHSGLIVDDDRMRAVTCGWTLQENFQFSLYYDKVADGYSDHSYLGIYSNKSIQGVGKLVNIIEADLLPNGQLNVKKSLSQPTPQQISNISQVIPAAMNNNTWDISAGHNFFCVDAFHQTDFKKITKYPLQGTKFFKLKTVLGLQVLPSTAQIATLLGSKTW